MEEPAGSGEEGAGAAKGGPEHLILAILAAVQFTSIIDFMVVMPLGPQLMRTLGLSPGQFGWIVSSYTLSAGVSGLFAAALVDRFDRRTAYLTLYGGFLVGTLLCGLARGYETLLAARVVTGAFGGILGGLALAIIGDVFPEARRGSATGALMSSFALASVVGVPFGLFLGNRYDWHAPFFMLVAVGSIALVAGVWVLPTLRAHLHTDRPALHPVRQVLDTIANPNALRAYALTITLMFGGFAVIPYISPYLVANVGLTEPELIWVYAVGGAFNLISAPLIGMLADRHGKLRVYRIVALGSAVLMLAVTNLPRVGLIAAVLAVALLMVGNAGRMVVALAMITSSVERRSRGSFMSVNSSVQHLASGLGAIVGSVAITRAADGTLRHFDAVGYFAVASTLLSLALAGRLRIAEPDHVTTSALSLGAADQALGDPGDPLPAIEST